MLRLWEVLPLCALWFSSGPSFIKLFKFNYWLFEVAFFLFALADKINILKKAKTEAEEKLISTLEEANQELEKRVKERTKELSRSNKQNESLLLNILPNHVIERIKSHDEVLIVDTIPFASILFADVVGFTKLSQTVAATDLIILFK